jgi:hypothetical protein
VRGLDATHVIIDGVLIDDGRFSRYSDDRIHDHLEEARGRTGAAAARAGLS